MTSNENFLRFIHHELPSAASIFFFRPLRNPSVGSQSRHPFFVILSLQLRSGQASRRISDHSWALICRMPKMLRSAQDDRVRRRFNAFNERSEERRVGKECGSWL